MKKNLRGEGSVDLTALVVLIFDGIWPSSLDISPRVLLGCGWIDSQVVKPETFEVPGWRVFRVGVGEDATENEMERPERRAPSCLG